MTNRSIIFIYDLNLLQMYGTKGNPINLQSIEGCRKGIETIITQDTGRVSITITDKDPSLFWLEEPEHYKENKYGDPSFSLKYYYKVKQEGDILFKRTLAEEKLRTHLFSMHQ